MYLVIIDHPLLTSIHLLGEKKVQGQHVWAEMEGHMHDLVLARKVSALSKLRATSEHALGLEDSLAQPSAEWSSRAQTPYQSRQDTKLVMGKLVLSHQVLSWQTTSMWTYIYARGACSDSLTSCTAQSLEHDGIRTCFSALRPQMKEQH